MASSQITSGDPEEWMLGYLHATGLENAGPDFCATTQAWFDAALKAGQGGDHPADPSPAVPEDVVLEHMKTDGALWASEYFKRFEDTKPDMGNLIGWFANAIEAGRMAENTRSISRLAFMVNQTAHEKGWWDPDNKRLFDGVLMLIVSEAAEALEEWRNNRKEDETYYSIPDYRPDASVYEGNGDLRGAVEHLLRRRRGDALDREALADFSDEEVDLLINTGFLKPEGIPSELADIVIRVFDCAVEYDIDIEEEIINKMAYNATRAHRHGGKRS